MTLEQYNAILREKWAQTDQDDPKAIKAYNRFEKMLRELMEQDD